MTDLLSQAWALLETQFENDFFTGTAMVGAAYGIVYWLRAIPSHIYEWCKRRLIIEIDIADRDPAFEWVDKWLSSLNYSRRWARSLTVRTFDVKDDFDDDDDLLPHSGGQKGNVTLAPAPGTHYFFYRGRFIMLTRVRKDKGEEGGGGLQMGIQETFHLKVLTRKRNFVVELLQAAREYAEPSDDRHIKILTPNYERWYTNSKRYARPIESVVLRSGAMESIVADINNWQSREGWYIDRGIPYRRGYLLYGPPGTGKSSTVLAIAGHLGLNIAILSLNERRMSDTDLRTLLSRIPTRTVMLIEDIDCVFNQREKKTDDTVTFSGLLNAIDGVAAGENRILFMTTNHIERLDQALIRPGRVDMKVELGTPEPDQVIRLFDRFYPGEEGAEDFVLGLDLENTSMAEIQGHFLRCPSGAEAVGRVGEIVKDSIETTEEEAA